MSARAVTTRSPIGPCLLLAFALLTFGAACEQAVTPEPAPADSSISADELAKRIAEGDAPLVLDVRTPEEYEAGHIPGARNIPHDQLADRLSELGAAKSDEIVVHCRAGGRARVAEEILHEAGYSRVRDLDGHMTGWQEAGLPTE